MLNCVIIAGALFVQDAPDGNYYNFHHLERIDLNKDHSRLYTRDSHFAVPPEWRHMEVPELLNTCAEQAEIRQRSAAMSK